MCIQGRCGFIFDYGIACLALAWCRKPLTNSVTRVTIKLQISVKPRRILRRGLIYDHNGYHRGFRDRWEHLAQEDTRPFAFQTKGLKTARKRHKLRSRMRSHPRGRGFESLRVHQVVLPKDAALENTARKCGVFLFYSKILAGKVAKNAISK